MASGPMGKLQTLLGLTGLVALGVTASIVTGVNPLDHVEDAARVALDRIRGGLSDPEPQWSGRVDGLAVGAAVTPDQVVVVLNGAVEARRRSDGGQSWYRMVDWATPAGDVVVAGRSAGGGFEVLDATSGAVRWKDVNAADVWPYQDVVLSLACRGDGGDCVLRSRSTVDGAPQWRLRLDGPVRRLAGHVGFDEAVERAGMLRPSFPGQAPRLLGVVVDGQVTVVDTRSGSSPGTLPEDRNTRVVMVEDRVLGVTARPRDNGGCRRLVRAWNASGAEVWRRAGFDFGAVSGSGCEPRGDPVAAAGVVAAMRPDGRPALLGARDGAVRWSGDRGEALLTTDGSVAMIRAANGRRLTAVDVETGEDLWNRTASESADVKVTEAAILIKDPDAGTITAVSPGSGSAMARWDSQATIVGADDAGVVLRNGRTVGYASW